MSRPGPDDAALLGDACGTVPANPAQVLLSTCHLKETKSPAQRKCFYTFYLFLPETVRVDLGVGRSGEKGQQESECSGGFRKDRSIASEDRRCGDRSDQSCGLASLTQEPGCGPRAGILVIASL